MTSSSLTQRLLEYVGRPDYRPVKPRVIAKKMELDPDERVELRMAIKRLVKQGRLAYGANHLVQVVGRASFDERPAEGAGEGKSGAQNAARSEANAEARAKRPAEPESSRRGRSGARSGRGSADASATTDGSAMTDDADESSEAERRGAAVDEELEGGFEELDEADDLEEFEDERGEGVEGAEEADGAVERAGGRSRSGGKGRNSGGRGERGRGAEASRGGEGRSGEAAGAERSRASRDDDRTVIVGVFRRMTAGHGFVRPRDGSSRGDRGQDLFIPPEHSRDASSGDLVTVRPAGRAKFGERRMRGQVLEILERGAHRFVGVYSERGGVGTVQVDGNLFNSPILVGDPGAKGAGDGDKVVVEMVRFPSHYFEGEGVVVEVLGARGEPGVDTLSIIHEFDLPREFPEDVLEAAREQAERFDPDELQGRRDLTDQTIVTIDPLDARDFDDAISLERLENGHWRLLVHIADVAHFVPERSALDREARERATSVYLPDRVIPMLPETISNHLASLQPDHVRFARTVEIELTPDGARVAAEVYRSAIKSRRRFTYEEVDEYLAEPEAWRTKLTPEVHGLLGRMHELAMTLRRRRLEGGAIELTLPEVKIDYDRAGRVSGAHVVVNTVSHQMIEECMLAANEAVATWLHEQGRLFLRRVHESPELRRLKALTSFVRELGIACESLESRFEIKRVVAEAAGKPMERAVNFAVLKSMQKAHYSPLEEGHYALHSRHYCHFTSPIRRYPDLTVHRLCDALARGRRPTQKLEALMALGEHCSEREQRAERAERELVKVKLLALMAERIGEQFDAVVTGVESFGLFAQGIELPAEGRIGVQGLGDDYYDFDASTHALTGRRSGRTFRLGDVVRVEIVRADVDRRELDLRLAGTRGRGARSSGERGSSGGSRRGDAGRGAERSKRGGGKSTKSAKGGGKRRGKRGRR